MREVKENRWIITARIQKNGEIVGYGVVDTFEIRPKTEAVSRNKVMRMAKDGQIQNVKCSGGQLTGVNGFMLRELPLIKDTALQADPYGRTEYQKIIGSVTIGEVELASSLYWYDATETGREASRALGPCSMAVGAQIYSTNIEALLPPDCYIVDPNSRNTYYTTPGVIYNLYKMGAINKMSGDILPFFRTRRYTGLPITGLNNPDKRQTVTLFKIKDHVNKTYELAPDIERWPDFAKQAVQEQITKLNAQKLMVTKYAYAKKLVNGHEVAHIPIGYIVKNIDGVGKQPINICGKMIPFGQSGILLGMPPNNINEYVEQYGLQDVYRLCNIPYYRNENYTVPEQGWYICGLDSDGGVRVGVCEDGVTTIAPEYKSYETEIRAAIETGGTGFNPSNNSYGAGVTSEAARAAEAIQKSEGSKGLGKLFGMFKR